MKHLIEFTHRVVYASLFALLGWHACVLPWTTAWQKPALSFLCYVLTYPAALIGQLTYPLASMDLFFTRVPWCHHCSPQEMLWRHVRFAVPVYVALFYVPALLRWIERRDKYLFRRLITVVTVYVFIVVALIGFTRGGIDREDVRIAAIWLVLLVMVAVSDRARLQRRWRISLISAVLLLGTGGILYATTLQVPRLDAIYVREYVTSLFIAVIGILVVLGLTYCIEYGIDRVRQRKTPTT